MPEAPEKGPAAAPEGKKDGEEKVEPSESKRGPPPGVVPLFFSGPSQQIFGCVVDVDLTDQNPHILIPKEKILEDFKNRAAVCDFHPVKQKMLDYPGKEVLLVYDYDFRYGENFYVCVTEAAKDLVLNPPVEEVEGGEGGKGELEDEEAYEIPKTPEPKEWVCLGSDQEILETHVHTSRPLLQFSVSRKRCHFNAPVTLSDSSGLDSVEIASQPEPEEAPLVRMEMETGVQAVGDTREAACQTERRLPCSAATQYEPRAMSDSDAQGLMEGEEMAIFLEEVYPKLEVCLQQNQIMDLFVDDCRDLSEEDWITGNNTGSNLKEYQSFTDLKFSKDKVINWIEWHPIIKGVIAVACGESYSADERIELSTRLTESHSLILIWNFTDPIHPQLFLESPEDIMCFEFNPSDPNIIVGGCINGQVVLWDITEHAERLQINKAPNPAEERSYTDNLSVFDTDTKVDHSPIVPPSALSSLEHSHSLALSHLHWIPDHIEICLKTTHVLENVSHFSHQLITCSIDGSLMLWDTRPPSAKKKSAAPTPPKSDPSSLATLDLTWKPFYKIPLPRSELPKTFSITRVSIRERQRERARGKQNNTGGGEDNKGAGASNEEGVPPIVSIIGAGEGEEIEGASTHYFIGTEDGEIVWGDWTPSKDRESGKFIPSRPEHFSYGHSGCVVCAERSPFFRDIVLSVGGWSWAVWREGEKNGPLLSSYSSTVSYTGGAWSPTRAGVFFLCQQNGGLEAWDLMDRSHEPTLSQNISSLPITSICPIQITSKQVMVAVGDSAGTLHILEVPWALRHATTNEVAVMEAFFERETKRLVFSAERARVRALEKKDTDTATTTEEPKDEVTVELESWEEKARKEYEQYLITENKLLIELGVVEPLPKQEG